MTTNNNNKLSKKKKKRKWRLILTGEKVDLHDNDFKKIKMFRLILNFFVKKEKEVHQVKMGGSV